MPETVILGLGSNLGDRLLNLRTAVTALETMYGKGQFSAVYESAALLKPGAPKEHDKPFLNMAARFETTIPPEALLEQLKKIERQLGRPEQYDNWSPRTMDIDILAYGDVEMSNLILTIPHAHLHDRAFALLPFVELWPDWVHPAFKKTALQLAMPLNISATSPIGTFL